MKQDSRQTAGKRQKADSKGRPKVLRDRVYAYIKNKILNWQLKAGHYLTDKEIAEELHISRTPIREALSFLEYEGYLFREDRRGWRIRTLQLDDLQDIFEIKIVLEGLLVKDVAEHYTAEGVDELQKIIKRMGAAAEKNDIEAWWKADTDMYAVFFTQAHNSRLCKLVRDMNEQLAKIHIGASALEGRMARSTAEHEAILECIRQGDSEKAEKLQKKHNSSVYKEIEHVIVHLVMPFLNQEE
ncbi:MAG: GntR family transcriptional regulator [Spirochaetia bacterium]|jgi:DNA-binding GntR family transcriptional regulator|nr:GntR family transcriptional regulator [Spirochaetia bacterium]